jgi:hypothetical protein
MDQATGNPPKKSGGGALKWILIGCGGIILLIVAFFAVSGYLVYRSFNMDPAKVESTAQEIVTFEKPAGYKGIFSMSVMGVKMAMLSAGDQQHSMESGAIILATFPGGKQNQEQFQRQLKESMEKQGRSTEVSETRAAETFKVKGKDVPAQVALVKAQNSNTQLLQYTLAMDAPSGNMAMIIVMGPEKQTDHAWVQKFLDTVK